MEKMSSKNQENKTSAGEGFDQWMKETAVNVDKSLKEIADHIMPPVGSTTEANMAKLFAPTEQEATSAAPSSVQEQHSDAVHASVVTEKEGTNTSSSSEFVMVEAIVADKKDKTIEGSGEKVEGNEVSAAPPRTQQVKGEDVANSIVNWLKDATRKTNASIKEFSDEFLPDVSSKKNNNETPANTESQSAGEEKSATTAEEAPKTRAPTGDDMVNWLQATVWKLNKKMNPQSSPSPETPK